MRVRRSHAVALAMAALIAGLLVLHPHAPAAQRAPVQPVAVAREATTRQPSVEAFDGALDDQAAPPPAAPPPAAPPPAAPPPAAPPMADPGATATTRVDRTTIAVLRVGRGGERVELVSWATKPIPFTLHAEDAPSAAATYVLEDARTGERLASGPCALPRLCPCPGARDHRRGCLRLRHEAVVRLKLPRVAAAERLTIVGPDAVPLATFALEGA